MRIQKRKYRQKGWRDKHVKRSLEGKCVEECGGENPRWTCQRSWKSESQQSTVMIDLQEYIKVNILFILNVSDQGIGQVNMHAFSSDWTDMKSNQVASKRFWILDTFSS